VAEFDPTEARRERGLAIAARTKIVEKHGRWVVPSQSGKGAYIVTLDSPDTHAPACSCPDFVERGQACKHVYAVRYVIERESHPDGTETVTESVTLTRKTTAPRPTYPQNWKAYNAAQVNEKPRFQALLSDLCRGISEPPACEKGGRPRLSLRDMVFSATFKVFSTVSGRRFMGDLTDAHVKGYIDKVPHFNSVLNYLESPALTPILTRFIAESALPLRAVELDFAVDSSGFTSSRFVRWFDHKYGKPMQAHDWVKVSLMTGVKTNIVTAVEVDERYAGDCPKFAPLVKATAGAFKIREVSADSAYSSYDNNDLVSQPGGTPYIAFKSNANPKEDSIYTRMFHFYSYQREEFLTHYHKRSNVETTFSMIKAKFGDSLRSKTDTAMVNESLCKVLCHNICCLIQSQYELGIEAKFWTDEADDQATAGQALAMDDIEALAWL
jgi:transposase